MDPSPSFSTIPPIPFLDLHGFVLAHAQSRVTRERQAEVVAALRAAAGAPVVASVVALNGIPVVGTPPTYFGVPVTHEVIRAQMRDAHALGSVLTWMNRSEKSRDALAEGALGAGHDWWLHTVGVTLLLAGVRMADELAFARDGRFTLSWVEDRVAGPTDRIFLASASVKTWEKYLRNRKSDDFDAEHRAVLRAAYFTIRPLYPDCF